MLSRVARNTGASVAGGRLRAVNLRGIFLCCRAVGPYMKQARRRKIVNISSGTVFYVDGGAQMH